MYSKGDFDSRGPPALIALEQVDGGSTVYNPEDRLK